MKFMTQNLDFSIAKAKRVLGYQGRYDYSERVPHAIDYLFSAKKAAREPAVAVGA